MTTPTNPSPMAKTEQEGPEFAEFYSYERNEDSGRVRVRLRELVSTFQANPQLRASVLSAALRSVCDSDFDEYLRLLPSLAPSSEERRLAGLTAKLKVAESELAAERARVVAAEAMVEAFQSLKRAWYDNNIGQAEFLAFCEDFDWHEPPALPCPLYEDPSQQPSPPAEPQQQGERVMPVCAADNCGLPCNDLTAYRVIRDGERFDYCCVECAIGHARSLGEASAEEAIQEVEAERDELRRKLEEARSRELAEAEAYQQARVDQLKLQEKLRAAEARVLQLDSALSELTAKHESQIRAAVEDVAYLNGKLQAAEAELQRQSDEWAHLLEAAELLRDSCADGDLAFRLRLEQWASRDQKRAATTEEQAAPAAVEFPAAVELPGGNGPDYVTRAGLAAALRKLAMCRDADTAPRHIAWQNLANELEAK